MSAANAAVLVSGVRFKYGERTVLDELSVEVPLGVVFCLVGTNGAGKTTLLRLMLGLLQQERGRVVVLGFDARTSGTEIRQRTGALLEHTGLYERLSAEANLDFYGRAWRIADGDRHRRVGDLLMRFGLWDRRRDLVGTWSRGMKQRLALARALLPQPRLLLLDEPTSGLDPVAADDLRRDLVAVAREEGLTVVMSTHNLHEAALTGDLVGVLKEGRLAAVDSPEALGAVHKVRRSVLIVVDGLRPGTVSELHELQEVISVVPAVGGLRVDLVPYGDLSSVLSHLNNSGARIRDVVSDTPDVGQSLLALMKENG